MNVLERIQQRSKNDTMPILTFPAVVPLGVTVEQLIHNSGLQVKAMKYINECCKSWGILGLMDLSVEAETFGAKVRTSKDEVPTVVGSIVHNELEANNLVVPKVCECRTQVYVEAIQEVCLEVTDKMVFPGIIGPFSLAGRLLDVSEAMIYCYEEPDMLHMVLEKVTSFLIDYATAFKNAGASGVVMAEPLAGILSPTLVQAFSCDYVRKIVDTVSDEEFICQ